MPKHILIVDDSFNIRTMVAKYLEGEGYAAATAESGRQALEMVHEREPDLLILDIMMPDTDGFGVLREFRAVSEAPVIMLTAKVEETDKVLGLELGADDYITKPFGLRELRARIRAVLRRVERSGDHGDLIAVGNVELDARGRTVVASGERVDLTPSEFTLLHMLMAAPGKAFTRVALLEGVQGTSYQGLERTIDVHVRNLRAKIEPDPTAPRYVETVYGVGYRFADDE